MIRPCPFCGQIGGVVEVGDCPYPPLAVAANRGDDHTIMAHVVCTGCRAHGPAGYGHARATSRKALDRARDVAIETAHRLWQGDYPGRIMREAPR